MKNYIKFTTYLAFVILAIPGISMANGQFYPQGGLVEAAPVATVGTPIDLNGSRTVNNGGQNSNVSNPADSLPNNILGIHIKTKAERDADKAVKDAEEARLAEEARVARNNDGTFAYGYTNGTGAQYTSGAQYSDARYTTNTRGNNLTASAGSISLGGFLPTTFWGWVFAILLIGILVAVIRALIDKMNVRKPHAHPIH
jgi:hypothetical protein